MMKCNCKCATCVRNPNIYENTPNPCEVCMCGMCESEDMCIQFCSGHVTIEEIDKMVELIKKGLTMEEAHAIIILSKEEEVF